MKVKPDLSFWKLWNISFGFFGVQIAYALQSANISRIFATLGADPHNLSYFWILPPLAGIIVQPIVGAASDKTWTRFGRRIPYLFVGSLVAVLVMCLLPNAGSFGMAVSTAMIFGIPWHHRRGKKGKDQYGETTGESTESFLDSRFGPVLLLVCLHVHVDLYQW